MVVVSTDYVTQIVNVRCKYATRDLPSFRYCRTQWCDVRVRLILRERRTFYRFRLTAEKRTVDPITVFDPFDFQSGLNLTILLSVYSDKLRKVYDATLIPSVVTRENEIRLCYCRPTAFRCPENINPPTERRSYLLYGRSTDRLSNNHPRGSFFGVTRQSPFNDGGRSVRISRRAVDLERVRTSVCASLYAHPHSPPRPSRVTVAERVRRRRRC